MGWIALAAIGGVAMAALRLLGAPRALSAAVLAALMLGATGYALQGRAALPGHPVAAGARSIDIEPGMVAFRSAIMPGTPDTERALATADTLLGQGSTDAAARSLLGAIERQPRDPALWTGLGSVIAAHGQGQLSPAAGFAFRRAVLLAPRAPGPPFFLGMAQLQAGNLDAAKTAWLRALALTPRDAPWRVDIAERLVLIDQFRAMAAAQGQRP